MYLRALSKLFFMKNEETNRQIIFMLKVGIYKYKYIYIYIYINKYISMVCLLIEKAIRKKIDNNI